MIINDFLKNQKEIKEFLSKDGIIKNSKNELMASLISTDFYQNDKDI